MVEPEVVVVPAGDALLGDPPRTEHVNVFAIARKPVSVGEYAMFVDATRHDPPIGWDEKRRAADRALEGVSWADAVAYCRWLTIGTGRIYRLPDEREWEKAAPGAGHARGARRPAGVDQQLARGRPGAPDRRGAGGAGVRE